MSMSKAMASQCSGEVYLLTSTNLNDKQDVPENGILWQVEFPTLIDPNRPADKKITTISYFQVRDLTKLEFEKLKAEPVEDRTPPEILFTGEYWPTGHGKTQLEKSKSPPGKRGDPQQYQNLSNGSHQEGSPQKHSPSTVGFVRRADSPSGQLCAFGETCYPYPYPMEDMYEMYKDIIF
ncbi:hypothetical protein CC86DRAFT_386620 [Ophiobolus disseminans]|uniref:Uncharacterized protein n=1 Tax=Ophiobolus disseminans TaxID=1469910 RepID=A0A6A6ZJZ6_9PLEO|nr:hypothetical protein CC86DRAFT_386620 [Ophiobolus disseminans]